MKRWCVWFLALLLTVNLSACSRADLASGADSGQSTQAGSSANTQSSSGASSEQPSYTTTSTTVVTPTTNRRTTTTSRRPTSTTGRSSATTTTASPYDPSGQPAILSAIKRGINFSNLEGGYVNGNTYVTQRKYFTAAKRAGFDHIRLPVNFSKTCGSAPDYTIDSTLLSAVDTAIQNALDEGLYIVLDMHGCGTISEDVDANKELFYALWAQLSMHYRQYSDRLFFEILNEPNNGKSKPTGLTAVKLNVIQNEAIKIIRKTNPTRVIVAAVADWNTSLSSLEIPENDRYILPTIHNYTPLSFTHQGADWAGYPKNEAVAWTSAYEAQVQKIFDSAEDWAKKHNRRLWLGEFGAYLAIIDPADMVDYLTFMRSTAEKADIAWSYWEFCYGFGIYNRNDDSWNTNALTALIPQT